MARKKNSVVDSSNKHGGHIHCLSMLSERCKSEASLQDWLRRHSHNEREISPHQKLGALSQTTRLSATRAGLISQTNTPSRHSNNPTQHNTTHSPTIANNTLPAYITPLQHTVTSSLSQSLYHKHNHIIYQEYVFTQDR